MAACSDWMPIGRPSPERSQRLADVRRAGDAAPGEFRGSRRSGRRRGLRTRRRHPVRPRLELPSARRHASAPSAFEPTARSTCASIPVAAFRRASSSPNLTRRSWVTSSDAIGEEPHARRIARAIVAQRHRQPIETGAQLADVVAAAAPAPPRGRRRVHPATRVFQALRIAVNRELETLPVALEGARRRAACRMVDWWSSATTRSRTASSSASLPAERRGCICPPEAPVCVCGRLPRLATLGAAAAPTERGRSRPQPALTQRADALGAQAGRMSRRNQARRRRAYGKRQHEVRERRPGDRRLTSTSSLATAKRPRRGRPRTWPTGAMSRRSAMRTGGLRAMTVLGGARPMHGAVRVALPRRRAADGRRAAPPPGPRQRGRHAAASPRQGTHRRRHPGRLPDRADLPRPDGSTLTPRTIAIDQLPLSATICTARCRRSRPACSRWGTEPTSSSTPSDSGSTSCRPGFASRFIDRCSAGLTAGLRLVVLLGVFVVVGSVLGVRLAYWQLGEGPQLRLQADRAGRTTAAGRDPARRHHRPQRGRSWRRPPTATCSPRIPT